MHKVKYKNMYQNKKIFDANVISSKLNIAFMMIVVAIIGIQKTQASEPIPLVQIKEYGRQIKVIEKKLNNLKVCSEVQLEKSKNPKDPCEVWQETPVSVISIMWSDGQPGGKIRIDVNKQALEGRSATGELEDYSEHSFSNSFDGATGRGIFNSGGFLGRAVPINEGVIWAERPRSLDDSWSRRYTGREFTMNFFILNSQGTRLSDLFVLAEDPNSTVMKCFDFSLGNINGTECIKISSKATAAQNWNKRWWLDPARGFALLRYEHIHINEDKTETFRKLIKVQELREVSEGVWWPINATCITEPLRSGEDYIRMKYHASCVVANNPNFDNNIFTIRFPKGCKVDDTVSQKNYIVDANLNMIAEPDYSPHFRIIYQNDGG
jgi:hypothetical protein